MVTHKRKVRKTFRTSLSDDGEFLYLDKIQIAEEYELQPNTKIVANKTGTKYVLINSTSTILEQSILRRVTAEQVKKLRKSASYGLIFKKNGILYYSDFESYTQLTHVISFIKDKTHMCYLDCNGFNPHNADFKVCDKVLNRHCNHIELYDFICDGYEIFSANNSLNLFIVNSCSNYVLSSRSELNEEN